MTSSDQPMDQGSPHAATNSKSELESNLTARTTWVRLAFMLLFGFLYMISRIVTIAVIIVQFLTVLISGDTNRQLKSFGHSLAIYAFEVVDYLTFNSETRPFPIDTPWPGESPQSAPVAGAPQE